MIILCSMFTHTTWAQFQKMYSPGFNCTQVLPEIPESITVGEGCTVAGGIISACDSTANVSFDDYLKRVVALEMSSSWGNFDARGVLGSTNEGMNALKAQAVASRTFALNFIEHNRQDPFFYRTSNLP